MANLTPEQLRAIQANGAIPYMDPTTGQMIVPMSYSSGPAGEAGAGNSYDTISAYGGYNSLNPNVGDAFSTWNADGTANKDELYPKQDNGMKMLAAFLAAAGGMHFLLPGMAGAAGAGGAGAGAAGAMGPITAAEAAAQSAALHSSLAPYAAAGGAAGGAASAAGAMGPTTAAETAALNSGLTSSLAPYAAGGAGAAGGLGGLGGAGSALGGALGGLGQYIVPALGAIGSAIDAKDGQSQTQKLDPRMDQFVYGNLMPGVTGLLQSQAPQAMQMGNDMARRGQGLLNMPIAGNGFGQRGLL